MATGYQGYSGYGDPARTKVDRARQMAELLQQGATDTSPKSFWEGAAQLGKAFIARGAMDKAEKAETEYGDNQKKALALFLSQMYPDAQGLAKQDLAAPAAFDLTPGAMEARQVQGGMGDRVRSMAQLLGDPMAAIEFNEKMKPAPKEYSSVSFGEGGLGAFDPTTGTMNELIASTPKAPDPVKMEQYTDGTGQVWDRNPYTGESVKANVPRARVPQDGVSSANDTFRPATPEDRARWGLPPEGAFKINERTGEPAAISGARAAQDFSPTEIRGFRDQADGLYILQNAVNQYVTMLEKMGGPQLLDTPLNAKNVQALKSSHGLITEAIKDAGKLGALDQGVQNLVNAIIQEPVGWGTFGKSTESIKQAANQLNSSIEFKLSRVPEEYRAGSTGKVPSVVEEDEDDDTFIDKLFGRMGQVAQAAPVAGPPVSGGGQMGLGPRPTPAARQPVQSQQLPPGVTPEMWSVMDDEDKAAFQR